MKIGDIFYENENYDEKVEFCNKNNAIIVEIDADEHGRRFQLQEIPKVSEIQLTLNKIFQKKQLLQKYKEDVEQVELFGMSRDDYETKKKLCSEIILELRKLEKVVKNGSTQ